jgi:thiol-disulfide isomerase/thioredoxin
LRIISTKKSRVKYGCAPRQKMESSFQSETIMKIKLFLAIMGAAALLWQVEAQAQSTNATPDELRTLVQQVQTKILAGKNTEADFTDELKSFDGLIAKDKAANQTDDAAQVLYMKAKLYQEIFMNTDKTKELYKELQTDYPDTKYGKRAGQTLASVDKEAEAQRAQAEAKKKQDEMFGNGKTFPDFSEKDLDGNPISVGALKGKVVMVDFWATWCGPCRGELPNVIATYKKHHGEGFDIIGVSLDEDRAKLTDFLKATDGMTWPQFFDGQGWQNELAVKYGVESIPFCVLVGADGKIVGKDLRGEALESAVTAALANK